MSDLKQTYKRAREISTMHDPYVNKLEKDHAARIVPELTDEQIQNASASRAKEYAETDQWLSKYKWDESKVREYQDMKLRVRDKSRLIVKGHMNTFHMGEIVDENQEYIERFETAKASKNRPETPTHIKPLVNKANMFNRFIKWISKGNYWWDL